MACVSAVEPDPIVNHELFAVVSVATRRNDQPDAAYALFSTFIWALMAWLDKAPCPEVFVIVCQYTSITPPVTAGRGESCRVRRV